MLSLHTSNIGTQLLTVGGLNDLHTTIQLNDLPADPVAESAASFDDMWDMIWGAIPTATNANSDSESESGDNTDSSDEEKSEPEEDDENTTEDPDKEDPDPDDADPDRDTDEEDFDTLTSTQINYPTVYNSNNYYPPISFSAEHIVHADHTDVPQPRELYDKYLLSVA